MANLSNSIELLNSFCKTLIETSEDFLKILGGMLLLVVTFLGLMLLISFSTSPISTVLNEKASWFLRCFCIKRMLGRNLHLSIALSIGSVIPSNDLLVMKLFFYI